MMKGPKPTGAYAVGTLTFTVRDVRDDTSPPDAARSVAARIYYPARKDAVQGLKKPPHMSRNMVNGIRRAFYLPLNYDRLEASGENRSECYEDAPWPEGERFPLILFNHGLCSYREANSYLCIELASQGYAVVSVTHPPDAACAELDDGSVVYYDKSVTKRMYQPFWPAILAMLRLTRARGSERELADRFDAMQKKYCRFMMERVGAWVRDTKAALDYLKEHFAERIDFEKGIGAAGHSMGGNTAYRLCLRDPEVVCGVNIDGGLFGDYTGDILEKPFLQVSCGDNENVVTRVYLRHTKPVYKAVFRDMKHMGFSDMKHAMKPGYTMGRLDPDEMHRNLCRCHLEFFDAYLKKRKPEPDLKSNGVVTVRKYDPDIPGE